MKKLLIAISLVLALTGCSRIAIDTKAEGEKLMQLSREWSQSASKHDVEKTLSYWADDATLISAGDPMLKGKAAIRQMVEESFKDPSFQISWEPQQVEIAQSGELGYLLEKTTITANDSTGNPVTHLYNSVSVWKKQADGAWKNVVDILSPEGAN
ncbi:MAG TPA: SgcJ/EcaC family oxidoreductase [Chryseolinea sp.]